MAFATNSSNKPNLKRKVHEYLESTKTVTIYVGPDRKKWVLNEEILCDRISYFKAVFQSGFNESHDKTFDLPDDRPEAFALLVDWVYTLSVECEYCDKKSLKTREDPMHLLQWIGLYVLADRMRSNRLVDAMFRQFECCVEYSKLKIVPETIAFLCENTSEDSALQEAFVEYILGLVFTKGDITEDLGKALAANETFNNLVLKQIREHMVSKKDRCMIKSCVLHQPPSG